MNTLSITANLRRQLAAQCTEGFRLHPILDIRQTAAKGRGVYAAVAIPAGTLVVAIAGRRYRAADVPPDLFAMQIDDDIWLCSDGSALDDCINHSCAPNLGFLHHDPTLYALRAIEIGEELTWDYSTSISGCEWNLDCLCGEMNCRRRILPFDQLPAPEQARLRSIALAYLIK